MTLEEAIATLERLAPLVERLEKLEPELRAAREERDRYRRLAEQLEERCALLERGLLGKKAERLSPDESQLSLAMIGTMLSEQERTAIDELVETQATEAQVIKEHTRKKPTGRKPFPEHLPRIEIEQLPDEVRAEGVENFERIGEDVTERLERRPASMVVVVIRKPKFVRRSSSKGDDPVTVYQAATPDLPIEGAMAGPGMLADTVVKRWDDHLPLHRMTRIYGREDIELAKSTMCGWHMRLAELGRPLIDAMRADSFGAPYLCTDATGVLVLAKEKCRRAHFWVLIDPDKHVLFEYTRNHTNSAVDSVLAGYSGYLVADAHVVYDHLYAAEEGPTEVNCWAHARRYFFKAMTSDPERARAALALIAQLFRLERALQTKPRKQKERLRHKHARPVIERFFSWCDAVWDGNEGPTLLEGTPLYDGVRYARNQRKGLCRFLDDGRLPIDNNISERALRRQAVGRKNWLFVGSDEGAQANAVFTSLIASAHRNQIEPWAYLRDLFCLLPTWPVHRVLELAPAYWAETSKREDVIAALANNPFRAATLR